MSKLIAAYRTSPTIQNAQKLRDYDRKHGMASCMLSPEDYALLIDAVQHATATVYA